MSAPSYCARSIRLISMGVTILAGAALVVPAAANALTAAPSADPSGYMCQHVPVLDATSTVIFGIEDMALDERNERLILSAYDRFAVMEAMDNGADLPGGGLFTLPLGQLDVQAGDAPLRATRLVIGGAGPKALHPHGIGLFQDDDFSRLAVISRLADLHDTSAADLLLFDVGAGDLTLVGRGEGNGYCRANDVALTDPDTAIFTFDQSRCGAWGVWAERVFQPKASGLRIARFVDGVADYATLVDDAAYANGVAVAEGGSQVRMTASRDRQMRIYEAGKLLSDDVAPSKVLLFDGGPDNVSITDDGRSVMAVHPEPFDLFLHINGWGGLPESRVVIVASDHNNREVIEGPRGTMPGAATSALAFEDMIVVSSAWDAGLGICRPAASLTELREADDF